MPYIAYQRHTPSGLFGADAASENVKGQLGLMAGMQQLAGFKQDLDAAEREAESDQAYSEGVQLLMQDVLARRNAAAEGTLESVLPDTDTKLTDALIPLARRMSGDKAERMLGLLAGNIERRARDRKTRSFLNELDALEASGSLEPEDAANVRALAESDIDEAETLFRSLAATRADTRYAVKRREMLIQHHQPSTPGTPDYDTWERLSEQYAMGAITARTYSERMSRYTGFRRRVDFDIAESMEKWRETQENIDQLDISDEHREALRAQADNYFYSQFQGPDRTRANGGAGMPTLSAPPGGGAGGLGGGAGAVEPPPPDPFYGLSGVNRKSVMAAADALRNNPGAVQAYLEQLGGEQSEAGQDFMRRVDAELEKRAPARLVPTQDEALDAGGRALKAYQTGEGAGVDVQSILALGSLARDLSDTKAFKQVTEAADWFMDNLTVPGQVKQTKARVRGLIKGMRAGSRALIGELEKRAAKAE